MQFYKLWTKIQKVYLLDQLSFIMHRREQKKFIIMFKTEFKQNSIIVISILGIDNRNDINIHNNVSDTKLFY